MESDNSCVSSNLSEARPPVVELFRKSVVAKSCTTIKALNILDALEDIDSDVDLSDIEVYSDSDQDCVMMNITGLYQLEINAVGLLASVL